MQKQMSKMWKKTLAQVCVLGAALSPGMGLADSGARTQEPTQTFRESREIFAQARTPKLDDLRLGKSWSCVLISKERDDNSIKILFNKGLLPNRVHSEVQFKDRLPYGSYTLSAGGMLSDNLVGGLYALADLEQDAVRVTQAGDLVIERMTTQNHDHGIFRGEVSIAMGSDYSVYLYTRCTPSE